MTDYIRLGALIKLAVQDGTYHTVNKGDTLSGIARHYGNSVGYLQRTNGIRDPNKLRIGQKLRIGSRTAAPRPAQTQRSTAVVGPAPSSFDQVSDALHRKFNNANLEAGILANIDRETGGTFQHTTWEGFKKKPLNLTQRQTGGYGLFQLTGPNLTNYKNWLRTGGRKDSADAQIDFMSSQYGPTRSNWRRNTRAGSTLSREQLADWWYRSVETPGAVLKGSRYFNPEAIRRATQRHNAFMSDKMTLNQGVWRLR